MTANVNYHIRAGHEPKPEVDVFKSEGEPLAILTITDLEGSVKFFYDDLAAIESLAKATLVACANRRKDFAGILQDCANAEPPVQDHHAEHARREIAAQKQVAA